MCPLSVSCASLVDGAITDILSMCVEHLVPAADECGMIS